MGSYKLLEREINGLMAEKLKNRDVLILREVRLNPCEMDIIIFNKINLLLINIEIKRGNWKALLQQAIRARYYCHFSVAALPETMRRTVPVNEFQSRGIGLIFYHENKKRIDLNYFCEPVVSDVINRSLKKSIYKRFFQTYGGEVYA